MYKPLLISMILFVSLFTACTRSHLEIFPALSDPTLVDRKLSVAQMKEDIAALYSGILERHPDLSSYAKLSVIENEVKRLQKELTQPLMRVDFYRIVGQLSHQFNDGHSFLIWPYQEYVALQESGNKPFPFAVEINAEGTFITKSYINGTQTIAAGSKILAINNQDMHTLIDQAQRYIGGETQHLREQLFAARFSQTLWSVFGYVNEFELLVKNQEEQILLPVSAEQSWQEISASNGKQQEDFYYKALTDDVGYLYIGHFDVDPDWFENFIDNSFEKIEHDNIQSLIIDIRDNAGGNTDTAEYLTSYLADGPVRMVSAVKEKLNHDNRGVFNYRGNVGEILNEQWDDWISPQGEDYGYKGETYLLISPISYSSAIVFATTLKDNQMATLIGQTTGGFANQTAQGNLFNLPHSELRAFVPTRLLLRPNGDDTVKGVQPDVVTKHSQEDLIQNIDTEIQAALAIINQKSSNDINTTKSANSGR